MLHMLCCVAFEFPFVSTSYQAPTKQKKQHHNGAQEDTWEEGWKATGSLALEQGLQVRRRLLDDDAIRAF